MSSNTYNIIPGLVLKKCVIRKSDPYCLYLSKENNVFRLSPWNADFSCQKWERRRWSLCQEDPKIILLHDDPMRGYDRRLKAFFSVIPQEVKQVAVKFLWMQFSSLRLMRFTKEALRSAQENPVLFWIIANAVGTCRISYREAASLINLRRTDVLQSLYGEKAAVASKWLEKVQINKATKEEFELLEALLQANHIRKHISHLTWLDLGTLQETQHSIGIYACPFFKHIMEREDCDQSLINQVIYIYLGTCEAARILGKKNYRKSLEQCHSVQDLRRWHDKLIHKVQMAEYRHLSFNLSPQGGRNNANL